MRRIREKRKKNWKSHFLLGYQIPGGHRQHGKRAMSLSQSAVTLNVPQVVAHKTVKLTVLPAIGSEHDQNKTSTFSTDINKPPTLFTSHGGLLEVDATDQTIDEHVKATAHTLTGGPKQTIKPQKNIVKRRKVMKGNWRTGKLTVHRTILLKYFGTTKFNFTQTHSTNTNHPQTHTQAQTQSTTLPTGDQNFEQNLLWINHLMWCTMVFKKKKK